MLQPGTEFKHNIDLLNDGVLSSLVYGKKHTVVFVNLISSVSREALSQYVWEYCSTLSLVVFTRMLFCLKKIFAFTKFF